MSRNLCCTLSFRNRMPEPFSHDMLYTLFHSHLADMRKSGHLGYLCPHWDSRLSTRCTRSLMSVCLLLGTLLCPPGTHTTSVCACVCPPWGFLTQSAQTHSTPLWYCVDNSTPLEGSFNSGAHRGSCLILARTIFQILPAPEVNVDHLHVHRK